MTSVTSDLDLGARPVDGWYWLPTGHARQPYRPRPEAAAGELRHCYSYERSSTAIKDAAIELIDCATTKVFVASFRFVDPDLRAALRRAAGRLRGGVYVITALEKKALGATIDFIPAYEEGEEEDWAEPAPGTPPDVNEQESKKHYQELCAAGVWVRGHTSFHAKFLVIDDRAALVSSANLESTALEDATNRAGRAPGFDAVTGESGVVTTRPADARLLGRLFARLWQSECTWDAPPAPQYKLSSRNPEPPGFAVEPPPAGTAGPVWTGAGDRRLILAALHDICARAREHLTLASFSVQGLDDHRDLLLDPVAKARAAGVRVRLLLRSRNFTATRQLAGMLAALGVEVYGDDKTHAKCAIADDTYGAIFSANFDAQHGIYSGTEVGMRLDGEPVLADVAHFFEHCFACAPHRLYHAPKAADCGDLASRSLSPWPLPAAITVIPVGQAWPALAAMTDPVLFTCRDGAATVTLHADGSKWLLSPAPGGTWRLELIGDRGEALRLDDWLSPRRDGPPDPYRNHRRGVCPALLVTG